MSSQKKEAPPLKAQQSPAQRIQERLEEELKRLMPILHVGYDLRVKWTPDEGSNISGEVRGSVIYIYETDESKAIEILKHELIDHKITKEIIEPLVEYVNLQKSIIEKLIYKRKEDLVENLSKLL